MKLEWQAEPTGDYLALVADDDSRPLAEVLQGADGRWLAAEHYECCRTIHATRDAACRLIEDNFSTTQLGAAEAVDAARAERLRRGWN